LFDTVICTSFARQDVGKRVPRRQNLEKQSVVIEEAVFFIVKEMPRKGIVHLTTVRKTIIRTGYFPVKCKVAQIIMIPKLGKLLEKASSYRPISLLPKMSKIFENAVLKRLRPILGEN
jgi:hypothetical protein